jgi:hypothetical protein
MTKVDLVGNRLLSFNFPSTPFQYFRYISVQICKVDKEEN